MSARSGSTTSSPATPGGSTGLDAVHELRTARRRHRLADVEWFEALYRVYLAAVVGGGSVLLFAGFVDDTHVDAATAAEVLHTGPAWLGLVAALAVAVGLRSGSSGGPLAVEAADVTHVLLAPLDRRRVLLRPAVQRVRSLAFGGAVAGAIAGVLASRRLPGTGASWALSGAVFGACVAGLYVGAALVSHGCRLPRGVASALGAVTLAAQGAAVTVLGPAGEGRSVPGPLDTAGALALWPMSAEWVHLASVAATVALIALGFALLHRMSLEALARRSVLVGQLRFAVALLDLRAVVLLRRQLGHEHTRARPWVRLARRGRTPAAWRRAWHGLLRFPASRMVRMALLAATAAACQVAAYRGTTAAVVGTGLALFMLGLELVEPLSQEIDHADRSDSLPQARGLVHLQLLAASGAAAVPFALVGMAVAMALEPRALAVAAVLAVPVTLAGAAGAVVNVVSGITDPCREPAQRNLVPPEVTSTTSLVKAAWPVALSIAGGLPVLGVRAAVDGGDHPVAAALRFATGSLLLLAAVLTWVRFRDDAARWWRAQVASGGQRTTTGRAP